MHGAKLVPDRVRPDFRRNARELLICPVLSDPETHKVGEKFVDADIRVGNGFARIAADRPGLAGKTRIDDVGNYRRLTSTSGPATPAIFSIGAPSAKPAVFYSPGTTCSNVNWPRSSAMSTHGVDATYTVARIAV